MAGESEASCEIDPVPGYGGPVCLEIGGVMGVFGRPAGQYREGR